MCLANTALEAVLSVEVGAVPSRGALMELSEGLCVKPQLG